MPDLVTAFAGSPQFAASILQRLADSKYTPVVVLTQPDRPTGRGRKVAANPVKELAETLDIPLLQPATLRQPEAVAELAAHAPDILIVAAYGLILPPAVLSLPTYGCINVHASLLPRWRGAAPIERAMMAGDAETGVCIMQMEEGLDTGGVYASAHVPISADTRAAALERELADAGVEQLLSVLRDFAASKKGKSEVPIPLPQNDDLATYAHKLTAEDRVIDWNRSASQLARQVMALGDRMPVRVVINGCGVQFLTARCKEQSIVSDESITPGTLVDASKDGLTMQCATDLLQVTSLKVERGKGRALDPAAAINGFKDLFYPGARCVAQ